MTRPVTFTQASINRAVKAARRAGLTVTGVTADGTVLVRNQDEPSEFQNNLEDNTKPLEPRPRPVL